MKIKWYGHSCFLITSENGTKVLMDPYKNILGYKLPKELEADIVSTSHNHGDHNYINAVKSSFIHIKECGTFSEKGIDINGVETFHDKVSGAKRGKNIIYNYKIDGLNVCHCGDLGHTLDSKLVEKIGNVDVLMLPVGGGFTIGAIDAVDVMNKLKPSVIIPMHYRTKALGILGLFFDKADKFIITSTLQARNYSELEVSCSTLKDFSGIAILKY